MLGLGQGVAGHKMCLPVLQEEDWRARESAILALGAIAEGCVLGLIPYLPQLVSMLLPRLEDPRPLVRSALLSPLQ